MYQFNDTETTAPVETPADAPADDAGTEEGAGEE